ncbi:MAG TPA: GNAT family N-acetyltransferase [Jatrophihabitantaceae bacterium]|nr:GNAT family N-acetyltransferase [Jatrophihabitantaceae bacterium]
MSDIDIVHPVDASEIRGLLATLATTFLDEAAGENFERFVTAWTREWHIVRPWAARADGRWVATLITEPHRLRIPDGREGTRELSVDGLTAVTVNATHRRRGLLSRMLTASLEEAKDRGDPLSILIAAEWPIYGRYGYAPATRIANYSFFPRVRGAAVQPTGTGSVRQVEPSDIGDIARDVFERARVERAGQLDRDGDWWSRRLGLDGYEPVKMGKAPTYYLHEGPNGPDGVLWWAATKDFDLNGDMGAIKVGDLVAASDNAYRNLWAYLAGIDVVGEIMLEHRPVDEPIRWLLPDGRALRETYAGDHLWVRLLDVPAALSARGYATEDRIVLDVSDDDAGRFGAGRFVLDSGTGQCASTTESADIEITQRALASLYLGGFTLREQRLAGAVNELTPGASARVDAMFATTLPPWNATMF